ncbi:MAG: carbohydrate ABC transporter permease [Dermatophilaceae bacterium]
MTAAPVTQSQRTAPRSPGARPRRRPGTGRRNLAAYLLVTPFFALFVLTLVVPLVYALVISGYQSRLVGGDVFVGLDNYTRALTDPFLLRGVGRVSLILLVQVPAMVIVALGIALGLDSGRAYGARGVRLLVFLPYAIPGVVAALMWGYLYGNDFGPIAQTFRAAGLDGPNLLSENAVLWSVMNILTWSFVGYNMVVLYAALKAIPPELSESAEIDGASPLQIARYVKVPAIRPALALVVVFSVIGTFQVFTEPSLLAQLAPSSVDRGFTPSLYAYSVAFSSQDPNYAAAISFLLGAVIAVVSYTALTLLRRRDVL